MTNAAPFEDSERQRAGQDLRGLITLDRPHVRRSGEPELALDLLCDAQNGVLVADGGHEGRRSSPARPDLQSSGVPVGEVDRR